MGMIGVQCRRKPPDWMHKSYGPIDAVVMGVDERVTASSDRRSPISATSSWAARAPISSAARCASPDASGKVAKMGLDQLIYFIAFISVSLGLVNLFPIPILDGGHLMFYAIEALRGKPLQRATRRKSAFRIGFG